MISLAGIAKRSASRAPMHEARRITITDHGGLAGDFRGRPGKRQVTVLSHDDWQQACAILGVELPWTARRANLLLHGISFTQDDLGKVLCIGDVKLEISCETYPCKRMDQVYAGLKDALTPAWRGGVGCRVLQSGSVSLGDRVTLTPPR